MPTHLCVVLTISLCPDAPDPLRPPMHTLPHSCKTEIQSALTKRTSAHAHGAPQVANARRSLVELLEDPTVLTLGFVGALVLGALMFCVRSGYFRKGKGRGKGKKRRR